MEFNDSPPPTLPPMYHSYLSALSGILLSGAFANQGTTASPHAMMSLEWEGEGAGQTSITLVYAATDATLRRKEIGRNGTEKWKRFVYFVISSMGNRRLFWFDFTNQIGIVD